MKLHLDKQWHLRSDISIMDAAYMLYGIDPIQHEQRLDIDDKYAANFEDREALKDICDQLPILFSAVRTSSINTSHITYTNGKIDAHHSYVTIKSFTAWCDANGYSVVADALRSQKNPLNATREDSSNEDWREIAVRIGNEILSEKFARGEREVSIRSLAEAIAARMSEPEYDHYKGNRGPRSASYIRNTALRGLKIVNNGLA